MVCIARVELVVSGLLRAVHPPQVSISHGFPGNTAVYLFLGGLWMLLEKEESNYVV